jgi:hypothetical protein
MPDVDASTPWAAASTSTHRSRCALRVIKSPQHHHPHTTRRSPCTPPSAGTWPRLGPPSCAARPSETSWPAPAAARERTSSSMPHLGSRPPGAACSPPCAPRHLTSLPHRRLANALRRSKCHLLRGRKVEQKFHRRGSPSSSYRRSAFGDSRDSQANSPMPIRPMTAPSIRAGARPSQLCSFPQGQGQQRCRALIAASRRRAFRARGHCVGTAARRAAGRPEPVTSTPGSMPLLRPVSGQTRTSANRLARPYRPFGCHTRKPRSHHVAAHIRRI